MRSLAPLILALSHAAASAAPVEPPRIEVVEAVLPDWPEDAALTARGTVTISFVLTGRSIIESKVERSDLPTSFGREALAAFRDWLIEARDTGDCRFTRGTVVFGFDSAASERTNIGPVELEREDRVRAVATLDRVRATAGRILRSDLAKLRRGEPVTTPSLVTARDRREVRWAALQRPSLQRFQPVGGSPAVPTVRIEPMYPPEALTRGKPGAVAALLEVGTNGAVHRVKVTDSLPAGLFDDQSRRALSRWKFEPARDEQGAAVPAVVCQVLEYLVDGVD